MSKKIKPVEIGILQDGYIRIAVDINDCPFDSTVDSHTKLEIYNDQNDKEVAILTHHCYDTQLELRPVVGLEEVKCPYFSGYHHGQLHCELLKTKNLRKRSL